MHVRSFLSQSCRNALQGEYHAPGGVGPDYSGESSMFFAGLEGHSIYSTDVAGRGSAQTTTLTDRPIQNCFWRLSRCEGKNQGHPDSASVRMKGPESCLNGVSEKQSLDDGVPAQSLKVPWASCTIIKPVNSLDTTPRRLLLAGLSA